MNNEATQMIDITKRYDHLPALKRWLMKALAKINHGKLIVHMDGETYFCGNDDSTIATLNIHHPFKMAWRCITKGDLGFAEAYLEGDWSSDDVTKLLKLFLKNRSHLGKSYGGLSTVAR